MTRKSLSLAAVAALSATLFLTSCGGAEEKTTDTVKEAVTEVKTEVKTEVTTDFSKGKLVYEKNCQVCHQADGKGLASTFPPLAGSDFLSNKEVMVNAIHKGLSGEITVNGVKYNTPMAALPGITDEETADVINYVYNTWGNAVGSITVDEVKAIKAKK